MIIDFSKNWRARNPDGFEADLVDAHRYVNLFSTREIDDLAQQLIDEIPLVAHSLEEWPAKNGIPVAMPMKCGSGRLNKTTRKTLRRMGIVNVATGESFHILTLTDYGKLIRDRVINVLDNHDQEVNEVRHGNDKFR